jgi:hypothetical protein
MRSFNLSRSSRHASFVLAIALLLVLQSATPAWAWGRLGHRVISRLAEQQLTPQAKAGIAALLAKGESIADVSTWADAYRSEHSETGPWHYVDIPLDEPKYDRRLLKDDPTKGCVVDKIHEFKGVLQDKSQPVEKRRDALKFLIHFVEDMHMPMHVGENSDRGGNDTLVWFFDRDTNLHSLWDGGIIARYNSSEDAWVKELSVLPSPQTLDSASDGMVEDWATESLLAAREAYQDPVTGSRIKSGTKLGREYYEKSLPVAKQRLYQAGVRLAKVINEAFAAE